MKKYSPQLIILSVVLGMTFLSCTDQNIPSSPKSDDVIPFSESFDDAAIKNANQQVSDVYWFVEPPEEPFEVEGAKATLLRTRNNVRMTIKTSDLDPHGTYTVWWVIFNNPEECANGCGMPDLFNDDVGGSVLYAAGHVIDGNGKGNFAGSLRKGDLRGCQPPWDAFDLTFVNGAGEMDLCREGLVDPEGAEIHLVVRTHGERVPGMVNDQINTFAGGCTADSSFGAGLEEGGNDCADQQFAVFLSP